MSINIISLNQIIALFKDFADRHYFINDFGYGATSDIGTSRQMEFPYMWVTTTQDSVINPQNKTAIPDLSFVVLFMDKTNNQENYLDINGVNSNNVQEILSDTLQTLQDFVTEVQVSFGNYGLSLVDVVRCYPGIDETQDSVNGWIGEFTLRVKHSNCILPTGEIVQTNLTPINPTTRYLTCDTLSNCEVIQDIQTELSGVTPYYGSFSFSGNQTGNCNTPLTMSADTEDSWNNGVSVSGGTRFIVDNPGVYNIKFRSNMRKTTGPTTTAINIWLSQNGSNVPNSATQVNIVGSDVYYTPSWNWFFETTTPNEYVEIKWQIKCDPPAITNDTIIITSQAASGNVPAIPGNIITINKVG